MYILKQERKSLYAIHWCNKASQINDTHISALNVINPKCNQEKNKRMSKTEMKSRNKKNENKLCGHCLMMPEL